MHVTQHAASYPDFSSGCPLQLMHALCRHATWQMNKLAHSRPRSGTKCPAKPSNPTSRAISTCICFQKRPARAASHLLLRPSDAGQGADGTHVSCGAVDLAAQSHLSYAWCPCPKCDRKRSCRLLLCCLCAIVTRMGCHPTPAQTAEGIPESKRAGISVTLAHSPALTSLSPCLFHILSARTEIGVETGLYANTDGAELAARAISWATATQIPLGFGCRTAQSGLRAHHYHCLGRVGMTYET